MHRLIEQCVALPRTELGGIANRSGIGSESGNKEGKRQYMIHRLLPRFAQPCVWMNAGLLTYKLCDRGLECDRCPLDAGLRGDTAVRMGELLSPDCGFADFPGDRWYTSGHGWIEPLDGQFYQRLRFGLDAFAATILGCCRRIDWCESQESLAYGDPLCRIDVGLGIISIGAPLDCRIVKVNPFLQSRAERLLTEPYGNGWIAELTTSQTDPLEGLLPADAAQEKARLDLQWFRRQVALNLLATGRPFGHADPNRNERLVDLREMLAGPTYLILLPELVH